MTKRFRMIDTDLQLRAYLVDLLDREDFLESQVISLRDLLTGAENALERTRGYIIYIQSVIRREPHNELLHSKPQEANPSPQIQGNQ